MKSTTAGDLVSVLDQYAWPNSSAMKCSGIDVFMSRLKRFTCMGLDQTILNKLQADWLSGAVRSMTENCVLNALIYAKAGLAQIGLELAWRIALSTQIFPSNSWVFCSDAVVLIM
jgi:hypothetical protein